MFQRYHTTPHCGASCSTVGVFCGAALRGEEVARRAAPRFRQLRSVALRRSAGLPPDIRWGAANILSPARFRVCNVKIHCMGVKMHDGMSWHGTSLYFSMERSLNYREIRKTYISVSVSSLNIAKNEKPIFLLFRSLIYRKHSGFL